MNSNEPRIILIYRRTRLQELVARHNTLEQARFVIQQRGGDFSDYQGEDRQQHQVLKQAERVLKGIGRLQALERGFLPNFIFGPNDRVVVIGQDGLVANTLKYLNAHPLLAINPDPKRYEGVLLPFEITELEIVFKESLHDKRPQQQITLAEAQFSDGQRLLAVNDFFIGPARHTTASYTLNFDGSREFQMSSGLIVSTGLGSTGWIRSITDGALGLLGISTSQGETLFKKMEWGADQLMFAVREPYLGIATSIEIFSGTINRQHPLQIESAMAEEGVVFSDGMLDDAISFNAGQIVNIGLAKQQGRLLQ